MALVPLALALPLLLWIAWTDFRYMRIRNTAVMAAVALFVVTLPMTGLAEGAWRLLAALLVFLVAFGMFAARMLGGGDVKMGAALMLFVPSGTYSLFAMMFSLAMMLGIAVILSLRAVPALRRSGPVSLRATGTFPLGIAFGGAALLHLVALILLS